MGRLGGGFIQVSGTALKEVAVRHCLSLCLSCLSLPSPHVFTAFSPPFLVVPPPLHCIPPKLVPYLAVPPPATAFLPCFHCGSFSRLTLALPQVVEVLEAVCGGTLRPKTLGTGPQPPPAPL